MRSVEELFPGSRAWTWPDPTPSAASCSVPGCPCEGTDLDIGPSRRVAICADHAEAWFLSSGLHFNERDFEEWASEVASRRS
jgi:hypothetical protein